MLDIEQNRSSRKYSRAEMLQRLAWALGKVAFRYSPRPAFAFRRWLLRCFGARIGTDVHIYPSVRIFLPSHLIIGDWSSIGEFAEIYNLGNISIGSRTTISQRAHLCAGTHDYNSPAFELLKPPVTIGDDAWVCADAFVGPGVHVGNGAIVAACAVVVSDVNSWTLVGGNPARFIKQRLPAESDHAGR